ncbi:type VI lipase adapter Tla3 domain-containing protein [Massilia sp. TWP1-3-3]|uniref:type VI lipase adapter Tla3 domain-containing protein n=1 Tax=Massilia sp. TWP1-3-3 TaxID=2804573 RepID=UPI003CE8F20E
MSSGQMTGPPKLGRYLVGCAIAMIILIPLWTIFVMSVVQPVSLMSQEQTMGVRLWWWVAGPVTVIALFAGARWVMATKNSQPAAQAQVQAPQPAVLTAQAKREYALEVIGLGVTLDKYRQGALWDELQKGSPHTTIREQDKNKYPWSVDERDGQSGNRGGNTLENGANDTPTYWGVPVFNAVAPIHAPDMMDQPNDPAMGLADGANSSGMQFHLFVAGPRRFDERPDRILEDVFAFFDAYPDVPYIVLNSSDNMFIRNMARAPGTPPLSTNGNAIPAMPDASALFVLARRERVDAVRPFAFEDMDDDRATVEKLNQHGFARRLFLAYNALSRSLPHSDMRVDRPPVVSEWLTATAQFVHRPEINGTGTSTRDLLSDLAQGGHRPPKEWKPTPWFPIPWNKAQLAKFDRLPTLGYIHRPTFVKFIDKDGHPLIRADERQKAMQAGWDQALQTLPEAQRKAAPARVIVATGGNTDQMRVLHGALNEHASKGGPELTGSAPGLLIDTDRRLGNTGAATLFMQMAIGVMGSYRAGGVSAAVNMRDPNEASIIMVSPPSEALRKTQHHPNGGDVFQHHGTPAVDPENYKQ